jgi:hypothetical protein
VRGGEVGGGGGGVESGGEGGVWGGGLFWEGGAEY